MEDLTGITGNSYVVVDLQKIKRNVEKIRAHIGENENVTGAVARKILEAAL